MGIYIKRLLFIYFCLNCVYKSLFNHIKAVAVHSSSHLCDSCAVCRHRGQRWQFCEAFICVFMCVLHVCLGFTLACGANRCNYTFTCQSEWTDRLSHTQDSPHRHASAFHYLCVCVYDFAIFPERFWFIWFHFRERWIRKKSCKDRKTFTFQIFFNIFMLYLHIFLLLTCSGTSQKSSLHAYDILVSRI